MVSVIAALGAHSLLSAAVIITNVPVCNVATSPLVGTGNL